jgi:hypothetical protein
MAHTSPNDPGPRSIPKAARGEREALKQRPVQQRQRVRAAIAEQSRGRISLWLNFGLR